MFPNCCFMTKAQIGLCILNLRGYSTRQPKGSSGLKLWLWQWKLWIELYVNILLTSLVPTFLQFASELGILDYIYVI